MSEFEEAVRYIQKQKFDRAKPILERLVEKAPASVADRARIHLRLCEQKLARPHPFPRTASEHHILGLSELNARRLDRAIEHLSRAHRLEPTREEVRYALAAAHALQGNGDAALEHLKAAIDLRPEDRFQACRDDDFRSLAQDPRFLSLVRPGNGPATH